MIASLLLFLACADKGADDTASGLYGFSATVSEAIPTVVTVTWSSEEPTRGRVLFGPGLALSTPLEAEAATEHEAVLLGLPPDTEAGWQVVLDDGAAGPEQTVTTGLLPNSLPVLSVEGEGHDAFTVAPMLGGVTGPAIVDADGQFVWFYEDTRGLDVYRARLSRDGRSVLYNAASVSGDPAEDSVLVRVALDGSEESTLSVPLLAHDFVELPDGTLTAIVVEYREVEGEELRGDRLVEVSPDGTLTEVWSAWDCFDPSVDLGTDSEIGWTFANALDYDEVADAYTLSIRNFSSLVRIPRGERACDWVFGSTGATLPAPADPFLHQHQFEVLEDSVLLFDNAGAGSTSRAMEYSLDPTGASEPELRWSYTPDPGVFTFVLGDVARLEDGDTLVDFAAGGQIDRVSPDGELRWRLQTQLGYAFGFMAVETDLYAAE